MKVVQYVNLTGAHTGQRGKPGGDDENIDLIHIRKLILRIALVMLPVSGILDQRRGNCRKQNP